MVEGDGCPEAKLERESRMELLEDLPRGEVGFMGVGTCEVEVELVERSLGEEVGTAGEGFDFEELVFDEAMDGFDVALVGVSARRDALVLGAEESDGAGEAIAGAVPACRDELTAVVGLPGEVAEVDATALEMGLDALGKPFTGAFGAALGES